MRDHDKGRRILLKGVVAAGAGLFLSGCDSEPTNAPASATESSPGQSPSAPSAPTGARDKLTQAQVQYQDEPHDEQRCETCRHFIPEANECQLVEGTISPQGWCIIWAA